VPEDEDGAWLAHTFGWRRVVAFPDQMSAISYVSQPEQAGRGWDIAFAPFGEWFGVGCLVVRGRVGGP
jgi:hypothetical protein